MIINREMVLRFTIFGLLLVLIAVIAMSHYANKEGFETLDKQAPVKPTGPVPPPKDKKADVPVEKQAEVPVEKRALMASTGSDLSKGSSLVPTTGSAAGPAPFPPTSMVNPDASSTSAPPPQLNQIVPQNNLSETGQEATDVKQKTDLLSSIQKIIRNELLASRSTDTGVKSQHVVNDTHSTQQGMDFAKAKNGVIEQTQQDMHKDGLNCPDMSEYIKKDSIPCWGCALDY